MKLRLTARLFLAILATCLVVTLAMGAAMRHSVEQGFREYVQEREAQRFAALTVVLQSAYRRQGSWAFLRGNRDAWVTLLRASREAVPAAARDKLPRTPPTLLLDAQGREVIHHGPLPPPGTARRALTVDGRTVGWLLTQPPGLPEDADRRFLTRQLKATWLIIAVSVALTALVALLLARRILAPVQRLAAATHALTRGHYDSRVPVQGNDELGQLAADFNALAATLEKNETSRREFVADISHELRTPLAVLKGELEALEDGVRPFNAESRASLQAEVATLAKLIDDLYQLSLGDVGALRYDMTTVNLAHLAGASAHTYGERFQRKGLRFSLTLPETPLFVRGDPQRLVQLLNNLLENSLRYTDPGGEVRLALGLADGSACLDLQDAAPGVPRPALPRLFERLFRLEASRSRDSGGAGLGLALSRNIVKAHGGHIEARPSPLGGLWIHVTLPRLAPAE